MNKKYYSTISSLKPSRKAVDAAVANALRLEKSGKVIEMKPANNKKKLTAIGTIAASLALIIALVISAWFGERFIKYMKRKK